MMNDSKITRNTSWDIFMCQLSLILEPDNDPDSDIIFHVFIFFYRIFFSALSGHFRFIYLLSIFFFIYGQSLPFLLILFFVFQLQHRFIFCRCVSTFFFQDQLFISYKIKFSKTYNVSFFLPFVFVCIISFSFFYYLFPNPNLNFFRVSSWCNG